MSSLSNLNQVIEQLKRDVQLEKDKLTAAETAVKTSADEKQKLERFLGTKEPELKAKETDVQKLKAEVLQAKTKLTDIVRNSSALTGRVSTLKRERDLKSSQLQKIQIELQNATKK
jgi:chromosome segregation ATPase